MIKIVNKIKSFVKTLKITKKIFFLGNNKKNVFSKKTSFVKKQKLRQKHKNKFGLFRHKEQNSNPKNLEKKKINLIPGG